jgi:hypothetical protein
LATSPIEKLSVWIDDNFLGEAERDLPTPEMALRHPEYPNAAACDFRLYGKALGDDLPERIELRVEVMLVTGETTSSARTLVLPKTLDDAMSGLGTVFPASPIICVQIGEALHAAHRAQDADRFLGAALESYPDDLLVALNFAQSAVDQKNWADPCGDGKT